MKRFFTPSRLVALSLFVFAGMLASCESQVEYSEDDMSLQAKSAIDVLPANPAMAGMVNVKEFAASEMGAAFQENMQSKSMDELNELIESTGFDPTEDLAEIYVTMNEIGAGDDPGLSMVAYASIDPSRLENYLEERAGEEMLKRMHRGIKYYQATKSGFDGGVSFANQDMILIASNTDLLLGMIDRLIDSGEALSGNRDMMNLVARASSGKSAWMVMEKPDLDIPDKTHARSEMEESMMQIFTAVDRMALAINLDDTEVESQVFLYPNERVSSDDLASLTKGVRSALRGTGEMDENAMKMLDDIRINASRDHVRIQFTADNEMIDRMRR